MCHCTAPKHMALPGLDEVLGITKKVKQRWRHGEGQEDGEREEEDMKLGWGELEMASGTTRTCLTHVWNSQRTDKHHFKRESTDLEGTQLGELEKG